MYFSFLDWGEWFSNCRFHANLKTFEKKKSYYFEEHYDFFLLFSFMIEKYFQRPKSLKGFFQKQFKWWVSFFSLCLFGWFCLYFSLKVTFPSNLLIAYYMHTGTNLDFGYKLPFFCSRLQCYFIMPWQILCTGSVSGTVNFWWLENVLSSRIVIKRKIHDIRGNLKILISVCLLQVYEISSYPFPFVNSILLDWSRFSA